LRHRVHIIIALAFWTAAVSAQPSSQPLSLEDCIRQALSAQSNATVARQQAAIANYARVQATSNFLPQTWLGGLFGYNSPLINNPNTFSYVALNGIREYSTVGNIGLELDTSGRLRAQYARAKADEAAAAANILLSERDLRLAVSLSIPESEAGAVKSGQSCSFESLDASAAGPSPTLAIRLVV